MDCEREREGERGSYGFFFLPRLPFFYAVTADRKEGRFVLRAVARAPVWEREKK